MECFVSAESRIVINVQIAIGMSFLIVPVFAPEGPIHWLVGLIIAGFWLVLLGRYVKSGKHYVYYKAKGRRAPTIPGLCTNPDAKYFRFLDILCTRNPDGDKQGFFISHCEICLINIFTGGKYFLSCYMGQGVVIQPVEKVLGKLKANQEDYFLFRIFRIPSDPRFRLAETAWTLALRMKASNRQWKVEERKRRETLIELLPVPAKWKEDLRHKWSRPTGYNWTGLFVGDMLLRTWTCVSICIYMLQELQILRRKFGEALLGIFHFLNPIKPIDLITRKGFGFLFSEKDAQGDPLSKPGVVDQIVIVETRVDRWLRRRTINMPQSHLTPYVRPAELQAAA